MSPPRPPLHTWIGNWAVTLSILARYGLYRMRLAKRPSFTEHWWRVEGPYRQITRMDSRIRVRHAERCPEGHPAIYVGNHQKLDDQFFVCYAVQEASNYTRHTRFVMRDDYFGGFPWDWLPIDMNEVAEMGGSYNIAQGSATLAQLKPLIDLLLKPDSFVIFPCGGRSRSGHWMEVHTGGEEPGSIAFFLAQAQRKDASLPVPAVPVGRTYNPIKKVSAVIVGTPRLLESGARREAQRDFDARLFTDLSDLVEIHMLHILSGILYLRALHGLPQILSRQALHDSAARVLAALPHRYIDPALAVDFAGDNDRALQFLKRHGAIRISREKLIIEHDQILACPPCTTTFKKLNTVKYHVNQIFHLAGVVDALESEVLRRGAPPKPPGT